MLDELDNNIKIKRSIKKYNILLIQDNAGDIVLTQRIFNRIQAPVNIMVINDGLTAYNIFKHDKQKLQPLPHLILLDLNLPGVNGLQILKVIKQHKKYKVIPVIILTTSQRQSQIKQAYKNHANTYISKPIDIQQFQRLLQVINQYWLRFGSLYDFTQNQEVEI